MAVPLPEPAHAGPSTSNASAELSGLPTAAHVDLSSLRTAADIVAALDQLGSHESALDSSLASLVANRDELDGLLSRIRAAAPEVTLARADAMDLAGRVDATAAVAERISGKVRALDLEQSRVRESIEMVQAVQDLKMAIQAIAAAVDIADWETATRHVQRAMSVDPAVRSSRFAEAVVPTSELPLAPPQAIDEFRATMLARFLREFEAASSARDEAKTSRFFKLFPMIGHEDEGLDAYARFVCTMVSGRSKTAAAQKTTSPMYFSSLLTPLLEQIALIVSQHQPVVEKYYGPGKMLRVAVRLQEECDRQAASILSQWEEERRITKRLVDIRLYRFPFLSSLLAPNSTAARIHPGSRGSISDISAVDGSGSADIEPREVDAVLAELAQMSGRWELYRRFLYARLADDTLDDDARPARPADDDESDLPSPSLIPAAKLAPAESSLAEPELELVERSSIAQALRQHMRTAFLPMEMWYLRTSVEKAHQIDEIETSARPIVSSALDDTFYVLKKVLGRLISAASASILTDAMREVAQILDRDFAGGLRRRIESALTGLNAPPTTSLPLQVGPRAREDDRDRRERDARTTLICYLNDLDLAAEYVVRLADDFTGAPSFTTSFALASELDTARGSLASLRGLEATIRGHLRGSLDAAFGALVRPKLRSLVADCLRDVSYVLDEESYADAEFQDVVRKRFVRGWDALVEPYKDALTPANYRAVFGQAVDVLVRPWEHHIRTAPLRFTPLGALRFDRDIRACVAHLAQQTPLGAGLARAAFARLQQIGTVLNLDSDDDANELVASNGWKLTQSEMSAFLALKVAT